MTPGNYRPAPAGEEPPPRPRHGEQAPGQPAPASPEPCLSHREPGRDLPDGVREAAVAAGRRRRLDPRVLERVRNALVRLPDSARRRHYYEIPGDCLASPAHPSRSSLASRTSRTGDDQ